MKYTVVLNNGKELECLTDKHDNLMDMLFQHNIFIVQENDFPLESTYIMPKDVSHVRVAGKDRVLPI